MKKVFLCEDLHPQAYQLLKEHFEIIHERENIDQIDALITRNILVNKELVDQCPQLKIVAVHGTGYDHVDVAYLKEKGIVVFHVPGQNALSVAEITVALILDLSRKISYSHQLLHFHSVKIGTQELAGHEISHKTIGLIGFGEIAKKVCTILQNGFSMKVIAYSPHLTNRDASLFSIGICQSIEEVFEKADIVSIHCPLNEQTRHLIDMNIFKHAKKNCLLINTARGAIVCEDDLYDALKQGIIAGAASDVFEHEPVSRQHPLLTLNHFIATPHLGATTEEALYRVGMKTVENLIDYFSHQKVAGQL